MILYLHYGGAVSCLCGGIFYALSSLYGRYAEQLNGAKRLTQISGPSTAGSELHCTAHLTDASLLAAHAPCTAQLI